MRNELLRIRFSRAERGKRTGAEREKRTGAEREKRTGAERGKRTGAERGKRTGAERERETVLSVSVTLSRDYPSKLNLRKNQVLLSEMNLLIS